VFRLRNDLYCVGWGVKLYSLTHSGLVLGLGLGLGLDLVSGWLVVNVHVFILLSVAIVKLQRKHYSKT